MNLMCVGSEIALAGGYKLENSLFFGRYLGPQGLISLGQKFTHTHSFCLGAWEKGAQAAEILKSLNILENIFCDLLIPLFFAVFLPPSLRPLAFRFNFPRCFPITIGKLFCKGSWRPSLGPPKVKRKQNLGRNSFFCIVERGDYIALSISNINFEEQKTHLWTGKPHY